MEERQRWTSGRWIQLAVLLAFGILWIAPLVYMVTTSLQTSTQILKEVSWIPSPFTADNYTQIFNDPQAPVRRWFLNSAIAVGGATAIILVIDSMAAYAFARLRFPGRDALFLLILSAMLVPGVVLIIPQYTEFANLIPGHNFIDTYWPLILIYGGGPFGVFLLRQFYLGIPKDLEEAAIIDGAGKFRRWFSVILPLTRTPLLTLTIFTIIGVYNDFLWPLIATQSPEMRTITVGIVLVTTGAYTNNYGPLMAFAAVAAVPMVILFLILQRYFVASSALSGVKG